MSGYFFAGGCDLKRYGDMKIEMVPIVALKPYERNAKAHPPTQIEKIANSIPPLFMKAIADHIKIEILEKINK